MKNELIINGKDALQIWGVRMGNGFIDALDTPLTMKDYIENESRMEHGKRIVTSNPKLSSRQITLSFTIEGNSPSDFLDKKKLFETELYKGHIDIQVPANSDDVFHLIYKGNCTSYGHNRTRTFCKFSAKFEEPNPSDRAVKQ